MKKLFLLVSLCGLALRAAAVADLSGESLVCKRVENRALKLFVFKPADWRATDRRPALVLFHGGSWTGGRPAEAADAKFERRFGPNQQEFLAHSPANRGKAGGRYFRETALATDRFLSSLGWLQGEPAPENLPTKMASGVAKSASAR